MEYRFDAIAFNSTQKKKPVEADNEHYIGLEHIDSGEFFISRWGAEAAPVGEKLIMKKGDVLFGKRRAYQRKVGIAPFDGIFSAHGMVLRPNEEVINKDFFPFFVASDQFMERAIRISVGGLSPTINWRDLKEQEFSLPPLAEQQVLADKLWAAYRLKESYKKLLKATEEMVKSQFIEMFGDPICNEKKWPTHPIKDVAPEAPSADKTEGKVWLLNLDMIEPNTGRIIDKVYVESKDLLSVSAFDEGNVLFSKLRPYLNKVVIPEGKGYSTTELLPLRPNKEKLNKKFFTYLLRSDEFVAYANSIATGTKMPRMPLTSLRKFECILPPIPLQQQFVSIAEQADKSGFVGLKSQFIEMFGDCKQLALKEVAYITKSSINPIEGITYTLFSFPAFDNNKTPEVIDGAEIKSSKINLEDDVILYNKLNVRLCRVWNIGFLESNNNICSSEFIPVRSKDISLLSKAFLYRILCSEVVTQKMVACSTGTSNSQKRITPSSLMNMLIPLPPIELQQQFVSIAEQADKSGFELRKSIEAIDNVIKSLINNQ